MGSQLDSLRSGAWGVVNLLGNQGKIITQSVSGAYDPLTGTIPVTQVQYAIKYVASAFDLAETVDGVVRYRKMKLLVAVSAAFDVVLDETDLFVAFDNMSFGIANVRKVGIQDGYIVYSCDAMSDGAAFTSILACQYDCATMYTCATPMDCEC